MGRKAANTPPLLPPLPLPLALLYPLGVELEGAPPLRLVFSPLTLATN